jgi:hypothetical protein
MAIIELRRGKVVRGPRSTATCELGLTATMATRWSRKLGELYLRQNSLHGEVKDVEELRAVLRLRGIRQWCSGSVGFSVAAAAHLRLPLSLSGEEQGGRSGMEWRERGRECGVHMAFTCERSPTTRRSWLGMNATRWLGSEPVGHAVSEISESESNRND